MSARPRARWISLCGLTLGGADLVSAQTLSAGVANLTLDGGADNDSLTGSAGDDVLTGRLGADEFSGGPAAIPSPISTPARATRRMGRFPNRWYFSFVGHFFACGAKKMTNKGIKIRGLRKSYGIFAVRRITYKGQEICCLPTF